MVGQLGDIEQFTVVILYFCVYVTVFACMYICVPHACQCPRSLEEGLRYVGTGVTDGHNTPCVFMCCVPCLCKSEDNLCKSWFSGTGDQTEVARLEWQVHFPPSPTPFISPPLFFILFHHFISYGFILAYL